MVVVSEVFYAWRKFSLLCDDFVAIWGNIKKKFETFHCTPTDGSTVMCMLLDWAVTVIKQSSDWYCSATLWPVLHKFSWPHVQFLNIIIDSKLQQCQSNCWSKLVNQQQKPLIMIQDVHSNETVWSSQYDKKRSGWPPINSTPKHFETIEWLVHKDH